MQWWWRATTAKRIVITLSYSLQNSSHHLWDVSDVTFRTCSWKAVFMTMLVMKSWIRCIHSICFLVHFVILSPLCSTFRHCHSHRGQTCLVFPWTSQIEMNKPLLFIESDMFLTRGDEPKKILEVNLSIWIKLTCIHRCPWYTADLPGEIELVMIED